MLDVSYLWGAIYGNADLKKRLMSDIAAGKLLHAYIIEGPRNGGKLTLARTIAAAMANTSSDVKKITSGACPDVVEITLPEKRKSIGVESVREMKLAACIKPNDLDHKFFFITSADLLTTQAQNALLKLMEDPPRAVYIFLLCENAASLLATIRSRAPVLRMQVFSSEELTYYLLRYSPDAQKLNAKDKAAFDAITRSSGGAYGEALLKIVDAESKIGDLNYTALDIVNAYYHRDRALLLRKIMSLPPDRDGFREGLQLLRLCLRDAIAYRATRGECDFFFPKSEYIAELAERVSLSRLLFVNDIVVAIQKDMQYNPNVQNMKMLLFTKLSAV